MGGSLITELANRYEIRQLWPDRPASWESYLIVTDDHVMKDEISSGLKKEASSLSLLTHTADTCH